MSGALDPAQVAAIERAMLSAKGRYVLGVPSGPQPREQVQIYPQHILELCAAWRRENGLRPRKDDAPPPERAAGAGGRG